MELTIPLIHTVTSSKTATILVGTSGGVLGFMLTSSVTGNAVIAICASTICSTVAAWVHSRPRYIEAQSHAKISQSELLGEQTNELIKTLKRNADEAMRVADYEAAARHKVQGFFQTAVSHIDYIELRCKELNITIPPFKAGDVNAVIAELDERIDKLKSPNDKHE